MRRRKRRKKIIGILEEMERSMIGYNIWSLRGKRKEDERVEGVKTK
jgi:hypothetical protein